MFLVFGIEYFLEEVITDEKRVACQISCNQANGRKILFNKVRSTLTSQIPP